MQSMKKITVGIAALCAVLASPVEALERLEPQEGCYLGFTLSSGGSISQLTSKLGFTPAVYVAFFDFSGSTVNFDAIRAFLEQVSEVQGIAMLTLEPWGGLDSVTENQCQQLAEHCAEVERRGIGGIFIRFCHEMNGNWYVWGQRPTLFKAKFRLLAEKLQALTSRTAMIWAPNYGIGYPFGTAIPTYGSSDFLALDTNRDGRISDRDDMYEPYYPGNDVVDWVGMTLYHWGIDFPWLENEVPPTNSFVKSLTGTYQGSIPNFYEQYCLDPARRKPMAITETAAFYNTQMPGPSEMRIKQGWWTQLFAAATEFPMLKCINWFDEYKRESVAQNNLIDWRVSANPQICAAFVSDLRSIGNGSYFLTAQETRQLAPYYVVANDLPEILPMSGDITVSLEVKAVSDCDLVIDLLDENFQWQGGTRVQILTPGQTVTTTFQLNQLTDRLSYRWSIFLTPNGADYRSAIVWYRGPDPSDDPDGDGAPNRDELIAGTSPRNAADVMLLKMEREGSSAFITWDSKVGCLYRLFSTSNLKTWTEESEWIPGTGAQISLSRSAVSSDPPAIYRLLVARP